MDKKKLPIATEEMSAQSEEIVRNVQASVTAGEVQANQTFGYDEFLKALTAVPIEQRGTAWVKAVILIHGKFRRRANLTYNWLNLLGKAMRSEGRDSEFDGFTKLLLGLMAPYTIGPHGYKISFSGRDEGSIVREMARLLKKLEELGYPSFINSGTLLGAVRSNRLISHDDDIDVAVILPGDSVEDVAKNWQKLKDTLDQHGMLDRKFDKNARLPIAKLLSGTGVDLDIFPAWSCEEKFYLWPHTFGELQVSDVLPLKMIELTGIPVPAPSSPELMLALNYGDGWRSPDPSFIFPWGQARKKFRNFIAETRRLRKVYD